MPDPRTRLVELAYQLGRIRGRSARDVMRALLASKTIARCGYTGGERLTDEQAEVGVALLENWIERAASEQHQPSDAFGQPDARP